MYLGEFASELPASGLLFPLSIRKTDSDEPVCKNNTRNKWRRKEFNICRQNAIKRLRQVNEGQFWQVDWRSYNAAQNSVNGITDKPELAILISCVGRKLVLDQRIEEEVEVVRAMYGNNTAITGFYSYDEISPTTGFMNCELHNQTMTITIFSERWISY